MSFGKNLERYRKENNISQKNLGNILGLTQQMISSYEKDLSSPSIENLCKIADIFNLSIDTLVDHNINSPDPNSSNARLLRYFESLTEADRERSILIIKTLLEERRTRK